MSFRGEPATPNRQAADWLARLHADDRTDADDAAFRAWIGAHPRNAHAFEQASTLWDAAGGLAVGTSAPPARLSRRAVMAGGAAVVIAGGSMLGWREAAAGVYRTAVGEQRRLSLSDGTRVMLDTDTRIRFRDRSDVRSLSLLGGRVDLEVAADPRPFVVEAGARHVTARAARLDVRRDGERTAFTTIAGTASIDAPGQSLPLSTGQRVAMADGQPDRLDRPELDDLIAWQSGRLAFRDETLTRAIAEMNRYSDRPLEAVGPRVGSMRLSGMYRVGDPESFARSLALLLPVRISVEPDVIRISSTV